MALLPGGIFAEVGRGIELFGVVGGQGLFFYFFWFSGEVFGRMRWSTLRPYRRRWIVGGWLFFFLWGQMSILFLHMDSNDF